MNELFAVLFRWPVHAVYSSGYFGVAAVVAMANLFLPVPTELILPLIGFLASKGEFSFVPVLLAATAGSVASALVLYAAGYVFGEERLRGLVVRFGRWARVSEESFERASEWFDRHGEKAVFMGRFVPGVGGLVSVPAGVKRMPVWRFSSYTAFGTGFWNAVYIGLGWILGARWTEADQYAAVVKYAVVIAAGVLFLAYCSRRGLWSKLKRRPSRLRGRSSE